MEDINSLTIYEEATIMDAIKGLSITKNRCLLVMSKNKKLLGVISEGDILRGISKGINIYSSISNIYKKDFKYLTKNSKSEALKLFKRFGITLIPIVDKNLYISEIITITEMLEFIKFVNNE